VKPSLFSNSARAFTVGLLLLTALGGTCFSHKVLSAFEGESEKVRDVFYLAKASHIRPFLLGQEAVVADLIWIRTLGYFADELKRGRGFIYLDGLIDLATDLDPRFEKLYIWAGAVFMYRGGAITRERILASTRILEKGWKVIQNDPVGWRHDPRYWMIPQMIGFNYAVELHDRKRGAPFIAATARIPGSPELYKTYAATLYRRAGEMEEGVRLLEDMLAVETLESQLRSVDESSLKDQIRDRLAAYYRKLYGEREGKARLEMLEKTLSDLISAWRNEFPFLDFDLYLLLRDETGEWDREVLLRDWGANFPLLSMAEDSS